MFVVVHGFILYFYTFDLTFLWHNFVVLLCGGAGIASGIPRFNCKNAHTIKEEDAKGLWRGRRKYWVNY